jgi:hypothetical protein
VSAAPGGASHCYERGTADTPATNVTRGPFWEAETGLGVTFMETKRAPGKSTEQARRFAAYRDRLSRSGITDPAELYRQTSAFVSPVEIAPHCAGAAVDLTLRAPTETNSTWAVR